MKYLLGKSDGSDLYFIKYIYVTQKAGVATPTMYAQSAWSLHQLVYALRCR
jgi:hypothetical protein